MWLFNKDKPLPGYGSLWADPKAREILDRFQQQEIARIIARAIPLAKLEALTNNEVIPQPWRVK